MNNENNSFVTIETIRVNNAQIEHTTDTVAGEVSLTIIANDQEVATLRVSPQHIHELVCGYLFTSGFINDSSEMRNFRINNQKWLAYVDLPHLPDLSVIQKKNDNVPGNNNAMHISDLSSTIKPVYDLKVDKEQIFTLIQKLEKGSDLFNMTGAVHTSILSSNDTEYCIDDIARHNSVDKVIGRALLEKKDLRSFILARTGRTSSEIVYKVRRAGIPVTISRGAPTHQAVYLCREMGITLVGFARKRTFNIYAHPELIN
ncbi:MAG: formate dehydrogenase accessory sulfurtransferase FdhD [Fibrobacter sp.]|nr:formate dehydrogenase accessory sulfurtransferase FdhD [Fibrobacter sp.]